MQRFLLVVVGGMIASGATAATIEIPWTLKKTIPTNTLPVQGVDGDFRLGNGGFDREVFGKRFKALLGLNLDATLDTDAVEFSLPGVYRIEAPDTVRAGSSVDVKTSFRLRPSASNPVTFRTIGRGTVDTKLTYDLDIPGVERKGEIDLPDNFSFDAIKVQTGGTDSFETSFRSTTAPEQVFTRSYFSEDDFGNQLPPRSSRFTGYEVSASDNIDGLEVGVDLYDAAANLPTPAAPFLAPGKPIIDLNLSAGADVEVTNTLSTNLATMYYTDDGRTTQSLQASRLGGLSQIRIPDGLAAGSTYNINFFALGLGYNIFSDLGLLGNIDLDLSADVFGVGRETELFSRNFTDSERFSGSITYYYESILTNSEFAFGASNLDLGLSDTTMSFRIAGQTCDTVVTLQNGSERCDFSPKRPETSIFAQSADTPFADVLPGASGPATSNGSAGGQVQSELAFDTPIVTTPAVVPLPAGLPLLAGGLGILAFLRRRRAATAT